MEGTIIDLCRKAKEEQRRTLKDIAEGSGVPINTVTNCFSRGTKAPAFDTIAPICAYLGVSMDRYAAGEQQYTDADRLAELEAIHERDLRIAHLEGQLEQADKSAAQRAKNDRQQRKNSVAAAVLSSIAVLVVLGYMVFDANIPTEGLIQHGDISVAAIAILALAAATLATLVKMVKGVMRQGREAGNHEIAES